MDSGDSNYISILFNMLIQHSTSCLPETCGECIACLFQCSRITTTLGNSLSPETCRRWNTSCCLCPTETYHLLALRSRQNSQQKLRLSAEKETFHTLCTSCYTQLCLYDSLSVFLLFNIQEELLVNLGLFAISTVELVCSFTHLYPMQSSFTYKAL